MVDHIVHFSRVDKVGHAKLFAQRGAGWVEVDTNNARGAHHFSALNYIETDTTQTKYSHCGTGLYLHGEGNCANASGYTTADIANLVEGRIFAHLGQTDLWQHCVVGERGATHIVQYGLAFKRESAGAVGHYALPLSGANCLTEVGFGVEAEITFTTFRCIQRDYMVARLQIFNARPYIDHYTCALMAQNRRECTLGVIAR